MKIWSIEILFYAICEKDALRRGVLLAHHALTPSWSLVVKAGIGGFHHAGKQLAGKACNGVTV